METLILIFHFLYALSPTINLANWFLLSAATYYLSLTSINFPSSLKQDKVKKYNNLDYIPIHIFFSVIFPAIVLDDHVICALLALAPI